jgi:hypothetical protein
LERHRFDQCRLSSAGLPDNVDVRKAVFVFYAEQALVIAKIDSANVHYMSVFHRPIVQRWDIMREE